jgi:hypothetical protein
MGNIGINDLRFVMAAVALFVGTFVGVSWASKGFPGMAMRAAPAKPEVRAMEPAVAIPAPEPYRGMPAPAPARRGAHDHLAQTATQAAQAYVRTPCDSMAKTAFIVAASTYLRAKATAPGTQSRDDARAHEAIKAAFDTGAIGKDEFPFETGLPVRSAAPAGKVACSNSAALQQQ